MAQKKKYKGYQISTHSDGKQTRARAYYAGTYQYSATAKTRAEAISKLKKKIK